MVFIPYNNNSIEIIFYQSTNNKIPFDDFLDSLNNNGLISKIYERLDLIKENRYMLKEPLSKYLEDGIFELRISFSNINIRILYFYDDKSIVLTNAFIKKTKKTPRKEIDKAKRYRQDYINRKGVHHA